jgi:protocatechuate 3,4-dioxygenase beta subunit
MSLFRIIALLAIALCCDLCAPNAHAQVKPTKPSPSATISGTVKIKGRPAPGVTVTVVPVQNYSSNEGVFKAKSDEDGKYRVVNIPPGNYRVSAVAPAFVSKNFVLKNEMISLGANESIDDIDFELVRGGVITGKVVDANGRPVVEQSVSVSTDQTPRQPVTIVENNAMTDDRGIYRMFGLRPGSYKVYVGQTDYFFGSVSGRATYKQTFHPGVTNESEATVIEVNEGSEVSNVDITVGQPTQTFAVSGIVIEGDSSNPVPNVRFGLQLMAGPDRTSFMGTNTTSNSKGEFRIENVPPGKYGIFLAPQPDRELRADTVSFELLDHDVDGLVLRASRGASIAGRVILENGDQTVWTKLTQVSLQVLVRVGGAGIGTGGFVQSSSIGGDGTFRIVGLQPGTVNINLGAADRRLLKGFSIIRIEKDEIVQPAGLEIKSGEQITNLKLVVSYSTAIVRGIVKPVSGELPDGTRVFLRITRPGDNTARFQPVMVDSRGHFEVEGLAAGAYDFSVTAFGPTMTRPAGAKQQVQVSDGVVTDVIVTIDLNVKPGTSQ